MIIIPVNRNVLKQTFYIREYSSMYNETDTITYFSEYMADRFVPTSKEAKFSGDLSLRMLAERHYTHYQLCGKDSIDIESKRKFSSTGKLIKYIDKGATLRNPSANRETPINFMKNRESRAWRSS